MRKILFGLLLAFGFGANAQTEIDALRYGWQENLGTARYTGMGGAFAALGGDLSSIKENPAASALYRTNEFSISSAFNYRSTTSNYFGNSEEDDRVNFNIPSFSVVRVDDDIRDKNWKRLNISFGLSRVKGFSGNALIQGEHSSLAYINSLKNRAQNKSINDLYYTDVVTYLAFNTLGIDTVGDKEYASWLDDDGQTQKFVYEEKGGITELNIAVGSSFNDKIYFGASVNVPIVNYETLSRFSEYGYQNAADLVINGDDARFQRMTLSQGLKTTGSGINAKLGFIAKPVFWWRFGLAYHTPTFYTLDEEYSYGFTSYFDNGTRYSDTYSGVYSYNLRTPGKLVVGTSFIIEKQGIISFEYNYSDYSNLKYSTVDEFELSDDDNTFTDINKRMKDIYTGAGVFKVGAEWRYENFSFRGGYNHFESPLKDSDVLEKDVVSFGLGYRWEQYFFDVAVQQTEYDEDIELYSDSEAGDFNTNLENTSRNFVFTFGYKF